MTDFTGGVENLPLECITPAADEPADVLRSHERLAEFNRLEPFDDDVPALLSSVVNEICRATKMPACQVNMVLNDSQVTVATTSVEGWLAEADGSPAEWSFCAHAVRSERPFIVTDAVLDPIVQHSPLVTRAGVRSYLGVPLRTRNDNVIGAVCVAGPEPRAFTEREVGVLEVAAGEVMRRLEARSARLEQPRSEESAANVL